MGLIRCHGNSTGPSLAGGTPGRSLSHVGLYPIRYATHMTKPSREPHPPETTAARDRRHALDDPLIAAFNAMRDDPPDAVIRPDGRGRVTIAALTAHALYSVRVDADGVVRLTPATVTTEQDMRQFVRSQLVQAAEGLAPDEAGRMLLAVLHGEPGEVKR